VTYKETDNLATLKVGDTLVMNDGSEHLAVKEDTDTFYSCKSCSVSFNNGCRALYAKCMTGVFHFEQIKP
jgi:hypothetical protein